MAMSDDFAFRTGAAAAMALPPQILVPTLTSHAVFSGTFSRRPAIHPRPRPSTIPMRVYRKPLPPARSTSIRFMPKPIPTMVAPSMVEVIFAVFSRKGLPQVTEKTIPASTASPGAQFRASAQNHGTKKNAAAARRKTIFFNISRSSSMQYGGPVCLGRATGVQTRSLHLRYPQELHCQGVQKDRTP